MGMRSISTCDRLLKSALAHPFQEGHRPRRAAPLKTREAEDRCVTKIDGRAYGIKQNETQVPIVRTTFSAAYFRFRRSGTTFSPTIVRSLAPHASNASRFSGKR